MNAGKLNKKIEVHGNNKTENEIGEVAYKFELIKSLYAEVIPQTGSLRNAEAETILTNVTHKIIVRYDSGKFITKEMKIVFKNHTFEIKYILNPYFSNRTLEIFVEEIIS